MRELLCPRCHGSGFMAEDVTLQGIAPLLDRPSGVNDDEWELPERALGDEKTAVREVPTFELPKRLRLAREAGGSAPPTVGASPGPGVVLPARGRRVGLAFVVLASTVVMAALAAVSLAPETPWLRPLERVLTYLPSAGR